MHRALFFCLLALLSILAPACEKSSVSRTFGIQFQTHDGEMNATTGYRAKLRVKASDGQTFEYATPISHGQCYLLARDTSAPAAATVDGDDAHLVCAGGGQTDEATVTRKSETVVEISVFQKAFAGPDTGPSQPEHVQTFSLAVPRGSRLRTSFAAAAAKK